jgi:hypothetical protein
MLCVVRRARVGFSDRVLATNPAIQALSLEFAAARVLKVAARRFFRRALRSVKIRRAGSTVALIGPQPIATPTKHNAVVVTHFGLHLNPGS